MYVHTFTIPALSETNRQAEQHPAGDALSVRVIETPSLGDRTYVVHDGEVAFVVDPQRDIDRVLSVLQADDVRLTHILETHIHNDYVTGGLALARATGAAYLVNAEDEVGFARTPIRDGDVVEVGSRMRLRAIATPGHTFTHLSCALSLFPEGGSDDRGDESPPGPYAVFTGGSLLYGATGRPDLLGDDTPKRWHVDNTRPHTNSQSTSRTTPRSTRRMGSDRSARPPSPTSRRPRSGPRGDRTRH